MLTILWWILGSVGLLILLFLLWLGYRALKFRRLQPVVFWFLSLQDIDAALTYIEQHPQLLSADAESLIRMLLDRAWAKGDTDIFLSGILHLELLAQCRERSVEATRQTMADKMQAQVGAMGSPARERALEIVRGLAAEGKASLPVEELDEELEEALSQIMAMLRPFADERTNITMDRILEELRQALQQKA
jgi:predicted nucleic acid-binding protein